MDGESESEAERERDELGLPYTSDEDSSAWDGVEDEDIDYEVKRVLRHRWNAEFNRVEFLVRWKHYKREETTSWEPLASFRATALVDGPLDRYILRQTHPRQSDTDGRRKKLIKLVQKEKWQPVKRAMPEWLLSERERELRRAKTVLGGEYALAQAGPSHAPRMKSASGGTLRVAEPLGEASEEDRPSQPRPAKRRRRIRASADEDAGESRAYVPPPAEDADVDEDQARTVDPAPTSPAPPKKRKAKPLGYREHSASLAPADKGKGRAVDENEAVAPLAGLRPSNDGIAQSVSLSALSSMRVKRNAGAAPVPSPYSSAPTAPVVQQSLYSGSVLDRPPPGVGKSDESASPSTHDLFDPRPRSAAGSMTSDGDEGPPPSPQKPKGIAVITPDVAALYDKLQGTRFLPTRAYKPLQHDAPDASLQAERRHRELAQNLTHEWDVEKAFAPPGMSTYMGLRAVVEKARVMVVYPNPASKSEQGDSNERNAMTFLVAALGGYEVECVAEHARDEVRVVFVHVNALSRASRMTYLDPLRRGPTSVVAWGGKRGFQPLWSTGVAMTFTSAAVQAAPSSLREVASSKGVGRPLLMPYLHLGLVGPGGALAVDGPSSAIVASLGRSLDVLRGTASGDPVDTLFPAEADIIPRSALKLSTSASVALQAAAPTELDALVLDMTARRKRHQTVRRWAIVCTDAERASRSWAGPIELCSMADALELAKELAVARSAAEPATPA